MKSSIVISLSRMPCVTKAKSAPKESSSVTIGFEATMWFTLISHGGKIGDISIYGQESNATTRRFVIMSFAIRGIEADIGKELADTFRNVQHPDFRADYVLTNTPFNDSDWFRKDDDMGWQWSSATCTITPGFSHMTSAQ